MLIRDVEEKDIEKLVAIYKPYVENTVITFENEVPTVEEFKKRVEKVKGKFPYLVVEENNEILGYAYASNFHERMAYQWTVEVSIYLSSDAKGKGLGKKMYAELEKKLKEQGVKTLTACITYPGQGSVQFHEKLGYEKVAHFKNVGFKMGSWYDVVWYQKQIANYSNEVVDIKLYKDINNKGEK